MTWLAAHAPGRMAEDVQVGRRAADLEVERSAKVEAVEVHDLDPRRGEVVHELLPCVVARVDLRERAQLGVRAEDEVGAAAGPRELARGGVVTLEGLRARGRRLPRRAKVEQVHEEVV